MIILLKISQADIKQVYFTPTKEAQTIWHLNVKAGTWVVRSNLFSSIPTKIIWPLTYYGNASKTSFNAKAYTRLHRNRSGPFFNLKWFLKHKWSICSSSLTFYFGFILTSGYICFFIFFLLATYSVVVYIYCFFWTPFLQLLGYLTLYLVNVPCFVKTKVASNKAKTVGLVYKPLHFTEP